MMALDSFSIEAILVVNAGLWLALHLGAVWLSSHLRLRHFDPASWPYRTAAWEREGRVYATVLGVRRWKDRLPDGARLFKGGFSKRRLGPVTPAHLERFLRETCRAELCHWLVILASPLFFIWNDPLVAVFMALYAGLTNLPCIITQRYNRPRLKAMLDRIRG